MDVLLPECRYLQPRLNFTARNGQCRQVLDLPEDAGTYLLEILKFLASGTLILATGVLLLLLG
ncbi:MAG: hypothetical protein ABSA04_07385 [Desulfobaccales bacterium]|jgi:hypothetical protein